MFAKAVFFLWVLLCGAVAVSFAAEAAWEESAATAGAVGASPEARPAAGTSADSMPVPSTATPEVGTAVQTAQEEIRDPFQPQLKAGAEAEDGASKTEPTVSVVLQGVGFGSQDSYAIINGDIYYVEEEQKGIKLLAVRRGEADVFANGTPQTLRLFDEAAMKKAAGGRRKPKKTDAV